MHTLMTEADLHNSPTCLYCGCKVSKESWEQVWDGHTQYLETECPDCKKPVHFKMEIPNNQKGDEQPPSSLETKIETIEYWHKEI